MQSIVCACDSVCIREWEKKYDEVSTDKKKTAAPTPSPNDNDKNKRDTKIIYKRVREKALDN